MEDHRRTVEKKWRSDFYQGRSESQQSANQQAGVTVFAAGAVAVLLLLIYQAYEGLKFLFSS